VNGFADVLVAPLENQLKHSTTDLFEHVLMQEWSDGLKMFSNSVFSVLRRQVHHILNAWKVSQTVFFAMFLNGFRLRRLFFNFRLRSIVFFLNFKLSLRLLLGLHNYNIGINIDLYVKDIYFLCRKNM